MTVLLGNFGDGRTMRRFGAVAAFATLGAIVFGGEAERYAQIHRPGAPLASTPNPNIAAAPELRSNALDYKTTGSLAPACRNQTIAFGACNDTLDQH